MPIYSVQGPDGRIYDVEGPAGASEEQVIAAVRRQIAAQQPTRPTQDTTGFKAAAAAGLERLKGETALTAGKLGLMDVAEAERYQKEREAAAAARFTPTQEGWTEAPLQKFKETLGGSLPYMAAPVAAGLAALAAPVSAPVAAGLGLAGAGALSAGQFTGSNIARQMQTGKTLEEASLGQAVGAAVPQALLDTAAMALLPGVGKLFGSVGSKLTTEQAKAIASQTLGKTIADYTAKTGMAMGREGLTEATQQALERLQAGLNLTDPEARAEYIESFIGGAALAGAGAPIGRAFERAGARKQAAEEQQARLREQRRVQAEEEAAAAKAEEERKQTPEYALEIEQQYRTLEQQKKDLQARIIKGTKENPLSEADKAANAEITGQLRELQPQLKEAAQEFTRTAKLRSQAQEQARLAGLTPEEFMMEQMGLAPTTQETAPPKMRTVVDDYGQITEVPEGAEEKEAPSAAQTYLQEQIAAAQQSGQLSLADYADYVMQDPKMAAEIVKTRTKMPDLTSAENNALLSGISLRLKEIEKQRAAETRAVMEQRAADLRAQQPTPEIENQLAELQQYLEETAEKGPSYVEPTFDYLNPLFEKALGGNEVIKVSETVRPSDKAPATRARVEALMQQADQADQDYRTARAARQPDAALAAKKRGKEAIDQIKALSQDGNDYAKEFLAARNQQNEALAQLSDIAEQMRTGQVLGKETYVDAQGRVQPVEPGKGVAAATEQSLRSKADRARAALITNILQEAATHRRAAGQAPLTQDEALVAASKLDDTIKAWMDRAMAKPERPEFEEVIVEPAQMRGTQIVRPAKTERRETKPGVQGISPAETAHFKARIDAIRTQLGQTAPGKVQKETPALRTQFAAEERQKVSEARGETATTLRGELRRRAEFVRDKMGRMDLTPQVLGRAWKSTRDALNKAADALDSGNVTRDLLDAVEPVVDAVLKRQKITTPRDLELWQADLRAIDDALKAMAPTAQEQKEAGQQQLDLLFQAPGERKRLAETDLGYIRMTPQAFANSPKVKAAREAIDRAMAALKRKAAKDATLKQRNQAAAQTLTRLKEAISNIKANTKFFWADTAKWTDVQLAKAYVGYPEIGNTPEEKALMDRYLAELGRTPGGQPLSEIEKSEALKQFTSDELAKIETLIKRFNDTKLPAYQKRLQEATTLLAQGQRLDDIDNQLLQTMQNANASTAQAINAQRKELAVLREAIKQIETLSKNEKISPLARRVEALQRQADKARSKYNERVEQLYKQAYKRMDDALAEILDPEIKRTNEEIAAAKQALEKEKAALEKIKKDFEGVLTQKSGANRTELATYELFRYEEKLDVIKDLEKKIEGYEASLAEDMETRFETHDQAAAVLEAVMDKKVQAYRDRVVALEQQIAALRGEGVLATEPGGRNELPSLRYPMAAQKYEADLKAAEAALKDVKRQQVETTQLVKSQTQQMQEFWENKLGGKGIKREAGRVEPIVTAEEKRLEKLRKEAIEKAERAEDAERKALLKQAELDSIDNEVAGLVEELGAYEDFPNELAALKKMAEDEALPAKERDAALAKAGVIQNIESLEAQREVLLEGKPAKKRGPATAPSTAAMGKQKPLRTGYKKALSEMSEGLRREREGRGGYEEGGVYGEAGETSPDLRGFISRNVYRVSEGGKGIPMDALGRLINRITGSWKNVPTIVAAENFDALPDNIKAQAEADGVAGNIPGVYDPDTKTVYLVADALHSAEDVIATVAHEIAGHFGLREMLRGDYTNVMNDVYNGNKAVREKADAKMAGMPSLSREVAVEEVLADMAEADPNAKGEGGLRAIYNALKRWFRETFGLDKVSDKAVQQIVANARTYVIEGTGQKAGEAPKTTALYRAKTPKYANDDLAQAGQIASKVIAEQKPFTETIKEEGLGMGLATRLVDRFAPLEKISKLMEPLKGTQMMYYARMFDQKMHFLQQAVSNGAIGLAEKTRADGRKEWLVESKEGASIKGVVDILKDAKDIVGSADAASQLFSLYTVAKRAERVGLNKLNFSGAVSQSELDSAMRAIKDTPGLEEIFENARKEYNEFNKGMVKFAVDTGALSKDVAKKMLQSEDYVPFYRMREGAVEMVLGNETIAKIGNLKNQPYLKELVGGEERILDFMVGSVQNANMLTDMALRNLATKSAVFEMQELGMAKVGKGTSSGPDVVNFKMNGEDYHAVIDTADAGFPAELLVKGMEGIPYQSTWLTKAMGVPAKILRQAVTLNPVYAARQLFRDSLAAPLLSGANFTPIVGALRQINQPAGKTLEQRGITGGQVFSGTQQDLSDTLRRLSSGESGWLQGLAKLEALSMEADALTRRAQYNSYIEQGLSEMEATYMALESMNFSKRGASPAMHFLSTVIPFFNAQIQGLNVLYKAFTGDMPFNEKLKIREKLLKRGAMLASATILYAALMQDDETYENATPEQKYGNWFIHVPGFEEAVKLPIPFEIGYIFKALPEALVNMMAKEEGGAEALKALKQIALQTIPGGSSFGIPQAIKPLIEVGLGKSFYTGRDLESAYEQSLEPGKRVRDKTTDFARVVGDMFNVSPIKIDALIQGYLSSTGLAMANALSFALPTPDKPEAAAKRLSEVPLVGGLFQPKDAGGIINDTYDRMNEAKQVKATFDDLVEKGQREEARRYLEENLDKYAQSALATNFTGYMRKLAEAERAIRASSLSPDEKRERLDQIRQMKIQVAKNVREASRTTPQ